jgi:hypothetical protein
MTDQTPQATYSIYWQQTPRQLFSFRTDITASDPIAARDTFRQGRKDFVIGVKEVALNGRAGQGGRWLA